MTLNFILLKYLRPSGKNSSNFLFSHLHFSHLYPFFTCSFSSVFTCPLRGLASLLPPLEPLPFLLVLCAEHVNCPFLVLSCPQPCVWSFSGKVWWEVKGKRMMIKQQRCWILRRPLGREDVKTGRKWGLGGRGVIQSLNCASAAPAVLLTACPGVSDRLVFLPDDCMLLKQWCLSWFILPLICKWFI